jgi:hypothetical protein
MWRKRTRKTPHQWQGPCPYCSLYCSLSAPPSRPPQYSEPPNECFPLQQAIVGRGWVYVPFQLSDIKEIKKDLDNCTDAPDQYIQAIISVIQTFELAWKDIMLLHQTLSSLEKKWVLAQATQVGRDFHLQWSPIPVAPGNERINMPMPTVTQEVPLADPH